jgi:hypothetical protein
MNDGRQTDGNQACSQRIWDWWDLRRDERRVCNDKGMTENATASLEAYVRAALALHGYAFDETQITEIVLQFSRLAAIAQTVFDYPLPFASEPAPVFRP